jgi:hypothetical protein
LSVLRVISPLTEKDYSKFPRLIKQKQKMVGCSREILFCKATVILSGLTVQGVPRIEDVEITRPFGGRFYRNLIPD